MESIQTQFQDRARELQERVGPQINQAWKNLEAFNHKATKFIRENPGTCLLGAVALGFVVGRVASRR